MERERIPESVEGCRAEARRLWKHLQGADPARARAAAARVACLVPFAAGGAEGVLATRARVRRKHALAAVADELGFGGWNELVRAFAARAVRPSFHTPRMESLVNRWYATHADARAAQRSEGGYVLPFARQAFVTEAEGVRALGLDPHDPDWERVGFDLVAPLDFAAFERLCARRRSALERGFGPASHEVGR